VKAPFSCPNSSDLIILPSYNEGIPLILLEAIFLGKAIIISNVGYINEVLGIDYPLFCYPGDVNSISSTIEKAIPFVKNNTFSNTLSALYAPFSFHNHKINLLKVFEI
jgi:glycosyltransferase involved in cell wall biosynthesis